MAWINAIKYKHNVGDSQNEQNFDIQLTFDKVRNNNFSLQDLANQLKNFFSQPSFMIYSNQTPKDDSKVVEGYCVEGPSVGDFTNKPFSTE